MAQTQRDAAGMIRLQRLCYACAQAHPVHFQGSDPTAFKSCVLLLDQKRVTGLLLPQDFASITNWVWQVDSKCHNVKVCLSSRSREHDVNTDMKQPTATPDFDHTVNLVRVKERCIYPNLKLRVYTTGMRQNRLAKLVGIDEAYLSRIINGIRVPGKQMQLQIAQVLGCDAEWLFEQARMEAAFNRDLENLKAG
jgi:plasmid maintenance system antidote protein VapI